MGRQPKPTALRVIEGTLSGKDGRGRHRHRAAEPLPRGDLTVDDAPAHWAADDPRREIWAYAIRHAPAGLLRRLDASIFEAWCDACDLRRKAMTKLAAGTMLVKTPNGAAVQSPYLGIVNRQAVIMKALAAEMGFTPAARTRISVEDGGRDEDPSDRFFA